MDSSIVSTDNRLQDNEWVRANFPMNAKMVYIGGQWERVGNHIEATFTKAQLQLCLELAMTAEAFRAYARQAR